MAAVISFGYDPYIKTKGRVFEVFLEQALAQGAGPEVEGAINAALDLNHLMLDQLDDRLRGRVIAQLWLTSEAVLDGRHVGNMYPEDWEAATRHDFIEWVRMLQEFLLKVDPHLPKR